MALTEDLRTEPKPHGTNNIAFVNAAGRRVRGVVILDEDGAPSGIATNATDLEGGGKISVGTTRKEITFTGTTKSIIIRADKDNTGLLFVGKADVDNTGANAMTFLSKKDVIIIDYDDNTNAYWVVSDTAAQNFWKGALK